MRKLTWITLTIHLVSAGCGPDENSPNDNGVNTHDPDSAYLGYTLVASVHEDNAHLIDMEGVRVHDWSYDHDATWHLAELLDDGGLGVVIEESYGDPPGMYFELDWNSGSRRVVDLPAHHDFATTEDGNTILLCREYVDDNDIHEGGLRSDYFAEATEDGDVIWEWHAVDHASKLPDLVDVTFPVEDEDWAHTNSVEILPDNPVADEDPRFAAGNLLFSMANLDTIGVIDRESGEILWAWGPGELQRQHMPTMLDNGHILVFDNGRVRGYTRILELDPLTEQIVWEYLGDPLDSFYDENRGGSQRLPNGNTFITDSNAGRLIEVTTEGEIVWEYLNPDLENNGERQPIYRATRYSPEFVEQFL